MNRLSIEIETIDSVADNLRRHRERCDRCAMHWERSLQLAALRRDIEVHQGGVDEELFYAGVQSPLGMVWLGANRKGLVALDFFTDEALFCHHLQRLGSGSPVYSNERLGRVAQQLDEYFQGRREVFDVPLDLGALGGFHKAVLDAVSDVPYGHVASYGDIAGRIGKPGASRAVGAAVATNPIALLIPCHRIVRSDGSLGEYALRSMGACGRHYKRALVDLEIAAAPRGSRSIALSRSERRKTSLPTVAFAEQQ